MTGLQVALIALLTAASWANAAWGQMGGSTMTGEQLLETLEAARARFETIQVHQTCVV